MGFQQYWNPLPQRESGPRSSIRLIVAAASGLDITGRRVMFDSRVPLPYDVLSLCVGSVTSFDGVRIADASALVPVKPMQTFVDRLAAAVTTHITARTRPLRLAIVGGGAAGVNCAPKFIARACDPLDTRCVLVTEGRVLEGGRAETADLAATVLERRGVVVREHCRVTTVAPGALTLDNGTSLPMDVAIWVTAAAAPAFLKATGLPLDDRGLLRTNAAL